jgi:hypothetical protein
MQRKIGTMMIVSAVIAILLAIYLFVSSAVSRARVYRERARDLEARRLSYDYYATYHGYCHDIALIPDDDGTVPEAMKAIASAYSLRSKQEAELARLCKELNERYARAASTPWLALSRDPRETRLDDALLVEIPELEMEFTPELFRAITPRQVNSVVHERKNRPKSALPPPR